MLSLLIVVLVSLLGVLEINGTSLFSPGALYQGYNGAYARDYTDYHKSYVYEYGVSDPHTGDHKSQWESKDKDGNVRGSYSLLEPDGTTRIVDYIADDHGFRAIVKKVGAHGVNVEVHGENAIVEPAQPQIEYKSYDGAQESYATQIVEPVHPQIEYQNYDEVQKSLVAEAPQESQIYLQSYREEQPVLQQQSYYQLDPYHQYNDQFSYEVPNFWPNGQLQYDLNVVY